MVLTIAKKKSNIKVSFVDSPSSEDVTGSLIFISTPNHKILVDAGLHQTNDKYEDYLVNNRKFKEFKAKDIDLIFITHDHLDHIGLIPKLYKEGCQAASIISENSKLIYKDMISDSAYINERDIAVINSQHGKNYLPLYTIDDVNISLEYMLEKPINEKIVIDDEISFELIPNGHLLGSVQVLLYIKVENMTKTLLITGDIGNKVVENHFVGEYQQVKCADLVIAESTYGDRPDIKTGKKERKNDLDKLKTIIDTQVHEMNGRVLIPTFAQSRCQALALMIYQLYRDSEWKPKVYIDSPLAITIFKDYMECLDENDKKLLKECLDSGMIHLVKESESSKSLVQSNDACAVLSTSGMCSVGRVRHHLKKLVPDANATILFVGFSTEGSLASLLKNPKQESITIDQKPYKCRCSTYSLKSMSGHAPFKQLVDDYTAINCGRIILHHGSNSAKEMLKQELDKEFAKKCQTTKVSIANSSLKVSL